MDIDALWRSPSAEDDNSQSSNSDIIEQWKSAGQAAGSLKRRQSIIVRRASMSGPRSSDRSARSLFAAAAAEPKASLEKPTEKELVLPTGVRDYSERAWLEPDIRTIRRDFVSNGIIFPKFQEGLNSYFAKDWSNAKKCFELVLTQREDGPSMYFLEQMAEHDGVPPRGFVGYSLERG
jgi:hypothetical protein